MDLISNKEILTSFSEDFGHLIKNPPAAIALPETMEEVIEMVKFCNAQNIAITSRGLGRSQSGQSIASKDTLLLDLSRMKNVCEVNLNNNSISCGSGSTWKDILKKTLPLGLIPPVMPLNLNLTVGGTLSVGGVGTSSHKSGCSAANVNSMEIINSDGEKIHCDAHSNHEYFESALCNMGRCAVIGSAELKLIKTASNIRTFYLLYDDIHAWIADQRKLVREGRIAHIQGICSSNIQGLRKGEDMYKPFLHWFYGLQISFEFDLPDELPDENELLEGLNFYKLLHQEEDSISNFSERFEARFELMKTTGMEHQPHPWIECILPVEVIAELLPRILRALPLSVGDGHRLIFFNKKNSPKFFKTPESEENAVFAILPTGVAPVFLADTLKILDKVHDMLIEAGGKRYLSGWLGMMKEQSWRGHYGEQFEDWQSMKRSLDPNGLFKNKLFEGLNL